MPVNTAQKTETQTPAKAETQEVCLWSKTREKCTAKPDTRGVCFAHMQWMRARIKKGVGHPEYVSDETFVSKGILKKAEKGRHGTVKGKVDAVLADLGII